MKKRIQKYLSGSNEGFSLVELIIVIAIMAILIGVVALAVIPYLEKSRESKDLQALDTVASAASTAVADMKVTGTQTFTITATSSGNSHDASDASAKKVADAILATLGDANLVMGSQSAVDSSGATKITVSYDTASNIVTAYIPAPTGQGYKAGVKVGNDASASEIEVACCQYNDNAVFCISNAKVNVSTAASKVAGS